MGAYEIHLGQNALSTDLLACDSPPLKKILSWAINKNGQPTKDVGKEKNILKRAGDSLLTAFKKIKISAPATSTSTPAFEPKNSVLKPQISLSSAFGKNSLGKAFGSFSFRPPKITISRGIKYPTGKKSERINDYSFDSEICLRPPSNPATYQTLLPIHIKQFSYSLKTPSSFFQFVFVISNQLFILPAFELVKFKEFIMILPFNGEPEICLYIYRLSKHDYSSSTNLFSDNACMLNSTVYEQKKLAIDKYSANDRICVYEHRPYSSALLKSASTRLSLVGKLAINLKQSCFGADFRNHILRSPIKNADSALKKSKTQVSLKYDLIDITGSMSLIHSCSTDHHNEDGSTVETLSFKPDMRAPKPSGLFGNLTNVLEKNNSLFHSAEICWQNNHSLKQFGLELSCLTCINPINTTNCTLLPWDISSISLSSTTFLVKASNMGQTCTRPSIFLPISHLVASIPVFFSYHNQAVPCLEMSFGFGKDQGYSQLNDSDVNTDHSISGFDAQGVKSFLGLLDASKSLRVLIKFESVDQYHHFKLNLDFSTSCSQSHKILTNSAMTTTKPNSTATDSPKTLTDRPQCMYSSSHEPESNPSVLAISNISSFLPKITPLTNQVLYGGSKANDYIQQQDLDYEDTISTVSGLTNDSCADFDENEGINIVDIIGTAKILHHI